MITILALCIPLLFLFLYIAFFSFEIGAALQAWQPHRFGKTFSVTPIWELTGVFLVFALVGWMAFFPGALVAWGALLALPALIFLSVQTVRIAAMMVIFYQESSPYWIRTVLVISTMLAPGVLLGGIVPVFLVRYQAYSAYGLLLALTITLIVIIMTTVSAVCFIEYYEQKNLETKSRFWSWIIFTAIIWITVTVWGLPSMAVINSMIATSSTAKMLLWICFGGIIVVLPGILLLYSLFL